MNTRNMENMQGHILNAIRSSPGGIFRGGSHQLAMTLRVRQQVVSLALHALIQAGRVSKQGVLGSAVCLGLL